jgi:uncharacterized coiled-coil protein SlyX
MGETRERKVASRSVAFALVIVCILLVAGLGGAMAYYTIAINSKDSELNSQKATISQLNATIEDQNNTINQLNVNVTNLQNQTTTLQKQLNDLLNATDANAYYNLLFDEFGNVSFQNPNYNFSPPVSMYHALLIALESDGWTASSLDGRTVLALLQYDVFSKSGFEMLHEVMQPVEDYSPVQVNDTTYRYVWYISLFFKGTRGGFIFYYIDAATAEMVQRGGFAGL